MPVRMSSLLDVAGPAISRCAQLVPPVNSLMNIPPLMAAAARPPVFLMSATSLSRSSRYSWNSGICQRRSPEVRPHAIRRAARSSSLQNAPDMRFPSAVTHAPVRVARSTISSAPCAAAYPTASARVRRPSASVFPLSMVWPLLARTTSPGFTAVPDGRFSVAAAMPTTFTFGFSCATARMVCKTAAAPAMSSFMDAMPSAGFRLSPPESNVMPLPTMATVFAPDPPPL